MICDRSTTTVDGLSIRQSNQQQHEQSLCSVCRWPLWVTQLMFPSRSHQRSQW
ncbi:MAG: hypothetical protein FE78DRAFT_375335 [Acidomyces sp. 'richmondensis']|nr:MAG: hypothetical protein FE78DRAFT_375335 [Acidomyces sp. 'richmondensis']